MFLALPLFLAVCVVGVDGASVMLHKRQLQRAADAAALAAARELAPAIAALETCNVGDTSCRVGVQQNDAFTSAVAASIGGSVGKNLHGGTLLSLGRCSAPDETNCWSWPYEKDRYGVDPRYTDAAYQYVQVKLVRAVNGVFVQTLGDRRSYVQRTRAKTSSSTD